MRAAQVRATLLWALSALAAAQEGVPRRGPPRGPIKEDKSTFFGKEGDQSRRCGNQPAVRAASASRTRPPRRRAVARAVASKAYFWLDITTRRSQREASPFTQFALTGCALLLVGLGLLQIFGTMVTVKARDETKKKQ